MVTSLKISEDLKKKVQYLSKARHRSAHWIMCEAIRDYVEREEAKENFKQEALQSWEDYCETGLHLSAKEVQKWLNKWGTNDQHEAPVCHK